MLQHADCSYLHHDDRRSALLSAVQDQIPGDSNIRPVRISACIYSIETGVLNNKAK